MEEAWPENANDAWQQWVVDKLKDTGAPQEQVDAVMQDIGARRFRPVEVVASSTLPAEDCWPVPFDVAQALGAKLEGELAA